MTAVPCIDPRGAPRIPAALDRALDYLRGSQLEDGAFRVYTSTDPEMRGACIDDASVFPCALIAHCLSFAPGADAMREKTVDFLCGEMDRHGLWRHWTRAHQHYHRLPPDLDDTSCASAALRRAGRAFLDNRRLLLANRNREKLFFTWFVPRARPTSPAHARVVLPQLLHAPTLWLFFARTSAAPFDVDAVVNANAMAYLGRGADTEAVVRLLLDVLRTGRERQCDKWYENPFAVWYFFARALGDVSADAADIIESRIESTPPHSPLDAALALCALINLGRPVPDRLPDHLLHQQLASGAWSRAALYHGGRARLRDGTFAEPHPDTPRWGSEELTTAFAIEALSRLIARSG